MHTAVSNDWVGRVVDGRFTLRRWLGGSGSNGVFLTELPDGTSQKAAIKLTPADALDADAYIASWATTANLSHPHLMRLFRTGRCEMNGAQFIYAVSEFAEEDLSQIIPERPLTPTEAREMVRPVLEALSYLHERGFVHGRLRPSTIMVVDDQVKLSSDCIHRAGKLSESVAAPTAYDAPEVVTGAIFPPADIWSLGATLVEALTQRLPVWDRSTLAEPAVPESVPQPFAGIAQECLRLDPSHRCTLSDIKTALDVAPPVPQKTISSDRTVISKRGAVALGVAALVLIAAVAILELRSGSSSSLTAESQAVAPLTAHTPEVPAHEGGTSKGVIVKGAVAERVLPQVSRSARQTIHGKIKVVVRLQVDVSGVVSSARLESPGPSKYFANLVLQAAKGWKFKPAQLDGHPVASIWILRFRFGRASTEVSPVEAAPPA
jgi:TonB family protein